MLNVGNLGHYVISYTLQCFCSVHALEDPDRGIQLVALFFFFFFFFFLLSSNGIKVPFLSRQVSNVSKYVDKCCIGLSVPLDAEISQMDFQRHFSK